MTLIQKFKKDLQTLRGAANNEFFLDVKNPKLYKKIRRYYQNEGIATHQTQTILIMQEQLYTLTTKRKVLRF